MSDTFKGDVRSCDVCNREREVYVHCSSFAAYSYASCAECLGYYAEPFWVFEYLRDWVDTPGGNALKEEVYNGAFTYYDNQYMPYNEWLKLSPYDRETFEKQVKEMNDAMRNISYE